MNKWLLLNFKKNRPDPGALRYALG